VCTVLVVAARRANGGSQVRALRRRTAWRVPEPLLARLARALHDADVDVEPEAALQMWATSIVGIGALGAVLLSVPIGAVLAGAVIIGGPVGLHAAQARHEHRFVQALPAALEQIGSELRGGGSVASGLAHLADSASPVARDAGRVQSRCRLGLPLAEALAAWPAEHDAPGVRAAAGSLAVAVEMGGRAADAIDGLASSLRARLEAMAEARSLSTQARLSAVVVGAAPLGYLAFASLVDASAVDALVTTGVGRVCFVVGVGLEGVAALWIRRIVTSEAA
jgi:tight adherence protein B